MVVLLLQLEHIWQRCSQYLCRCSDVAGEGCVFMPSGMGAPLIVREKHMGRQTITAISALIDLQLVGDYADGNLISMG